MRFSMRKWLLWLGVGWILCGVSAVYANTWLVVGDSLSAAYGIEMEEGWVALLQKRLAAEGHEQQVVNASISGDTTAGGLTRLPALLEEHQPTLTMIELGANDGLRGLSTITMQQHLREMIHLARAAGSDVLLLGMHIPPNYGQRYSEMFHHVYHHLAQSEDVPLLAFLLAGVGGEAALMQDDGLHPTAEAQPIMLENVWPFLVQQIAKEQE
ncbi:MAG TPA: arylesterase [Alcanivoracaceae bacterium]|nr:arylesterase [Alcanivoracaceae bacterium]